MNAVRYWIAVVLVVTMPPAVLYWFILHPFTAFWRRRGSPVTFTVITVACLGAVWVLFRYRDSLVMTDLGTNYWLVALAAPIYGVAVVLGLRRRKLLTLNILVGAPQLSDGGPGALLTTGVYGQMRNPRYAEVFVGIVAFALFTNYTGLYLLIPLMALGLYLIVLLEERELRERFGEEYEDYCRRVPRFIPHLRSARG